MISSLLIAFGVGEQPHNKVTDTTSNKSKSIYKYDRRILGENIKAVINKTHELVEKYGYPTKIYTGPFARCRDTMMIMINEIIFMKTNVKHNFCLKCYNHEIKIKIDRKLSKHSHHLKNELDHISPQTLKYAPTKEKNNDFDTRLDKHIDSMKTHINDNIWCITHAYVYKHIGKKLGIETPRKIDFLEHFTYQNDDHHI